MICYIHACEKPCEQCAHAYFIGRVFGPTYSTRPIGTAPAVITFKPGVWEHIYHPWETPRHIDTPQELMRESSSRGMESEYLRDSSLWRSRPPKEW
jgi:hypothetical protein